MIGSGAGRITASHLLNRVTVWVLLCFMATPVVVVVVLSFSNDANLRFPPRTWGFRQYVELFQSETWLNAIGTSLAIAVPTALIATAIGLLGAFAMQRTRLRFVQTLSFSGIAPLIVPIAAYAVALYGLFARLGLTATPAGVILSHTIVSMPFALIVLEPALRSIRVELELIAMTLGATRAQAWRSVTLPMLTPAVFASLILTFLSSFDEAVLVNFVGGGVIVTLPKAIFDSIRFGVDPLIAAISTLFMLSVALLGLVAGILQRKKG